MTIIGQNISASYTSGVQLFQSLTFTIEHGRRCAITGKNGTGKSTLIKIFAGLLAPSSGTLSFADEHNNSIELHRNMIGCAAPYLTLYEEFTPTELLDLDAELRGMTRNTIRGEELLRRWGLYHRKDSAVTTFSTGMKQRMKFILAMHHAPSLLLLDEPSATMDDDGISTLSAVLDEATASGTTIIIATNEERDAALCNQRIAIEPIVRRQKIQVSPNTDTASSVVG